MEIIEEIIATFVVDGVKGIALMLLPYWAWSLVFFGGLIGFFYCLKKSTRLKTLIFSTGLCMATTFFVMKSFI